MRKKSVMRLDRDSTKTLHFPDKHPGILQRMFSAFIRVQIKEREKGIAIKIGTWEIVAIHKSLLALDRWDHMDCVLISTTAPLATSFLLCRNLKTVIPTEMNSMLNTAILAWDTWMLSSSKGGKRGDIIKVFWNPYRIKIL